MCMQIRTWFEGNGYNRKCLRVPSPCLPCEGTPFDLMGAEGSRKKRAGLEDMSE